MKREYLEAMVDAAARAYAQQDADGTSPSLACVAEQLGLSVPTVRRLLITAGVYHSERVDAVSQLLAQGLSVAQAMEQLHMTRAAITACLPYGLPRAQPSPTMMQLPNTLDACKKQALARFHQEMTADMLWETLRAFSGMTFRTAKGLDFTYTLRGSEMFVDRKEKSITRATVELAFYKALELGADAIGPKKLGCFGASYLYPIFIGLGVIPLAGEMSC